MILIYCFDIRIKINRRYFNFLIRKLITIFITFIIKKENTYRRSIQNITTLNVPVFLDGKILFARKYPSNLHTVPEILTKERKITMCVCQSQFHAHARVSNVFKDVTHMYGSMLQVWKTIDQNLIISV